MFDHFLAIYRGACRARHNDEQLKALLLKIEHDAALLADRNLSTFDRNLPLMTMEELADFLIPHLTRELKQKRARANACIY